MGDAISGKPAALPGAQCRFWRSDHCGGYSYFQGLESLGVSTRQNALGRGRKTFESRTGKIQAGRAPLADSAWALCLQGA